MKDEWRGNYQALMVSTDAILDRIVHHSRHIELKSESMR